MGDSLSHLDDLLELSYFIVVEIPRILIKVNP